MWSLKARISWTLGAKKSWKNEFHESKSALEGWKPCQEEGFGRMKTLKERKLLKDEDLESKIVLEECGP